MEYEIKVKKGKLVTLLNILGAIFYERDWKLIKKNSHRWNDDICMIIDFELTDTNHIWPRIFLNLKGQNVIGHFSDEEVAKKFVQSLYPCVAETFNCAHNNRVRLSANPGSWS